MEKEFVAWLEGIGFTDESAFTEAQLAGLKKEFKAKQGVSPDTFEETVSDIANQRRARMQQGQKIRAICQAAMDDHPMFVDQIEALGKAALESQTDPDKFELELIRATRSRKGQFVAQMQGTASDPKVIEAAICMASGLPNIEKHYSPQVLEAVDRSGMSRGFSLQQTLMQVAHSNGFACRAGERIHVGNIRAVLEYCFPPVTARLAGFSTISLPNILGAVANKQILAGYMEEDNTWREFATVKPVSNFHTQNHYRMLDSLEYEEVGSGGELKHGTLGEETYTSQAKTYGKMLAITRTQIINDDLGAFDDMRTRLGRGASKKFNNLFWATFLNNSALFTTALTNYIEGATTNLGTDGVGLTAGVLQFRKMTSVAADGTKRVGQSTRPTKVLVPPELEFIADRLFVAGSPDAQTVANSNPFRNKYRPIVQNRLSDSTFTGYSTTAWYLFGDELRPMLVTFLNGQQTPTVESTDADFEVLGIQFRGYHDFGCDRAEYLAGLKSKGAA
jgi:hypothetical protein